MAFSGDRFIVRCTADASVAFGIEILYTANNSAAESIGFEQGQTISSGGGDLDLAAANTVLFAIAS